MKRPLGVIDLDDVLAFSAEGFLDYSNRQWGTSLGIDDYNEDWTSMWGVSHEEARRRSMEWHASDEMLHHDPLPYALPVLSAMTNRYDLAIGTSRRRELEPVTRQWVDQHFPGVFSAIYFSGIWEEFGKEAHLVTKAQMCQELNAAFLVDDQPKHCIGAVEVGAEAVLFGDRAWNRDAELPPGVVRLADWQAVGAHFGVC